MPTATKPQPKLKVPVGTLIPPDLGPDGYRQMMEDFNYMQTLLGRLQTDRAPYINHWYDVQAYIDPHLVIWDPSMTGFPQFDDILPYSAPFQSFDDMINGFQMNLTPAYQKWWETQPEDEELENDDEVQDFCHKVDEIYKQTFDESNFYNTTPGFYRCGTRFLTAAIMAEEDFKTRARFKLFPIGSFYCSNNSRGIVDTFIYEFRWKLRQVVEQFCTDEEGNIDLSRLDRTIQARWNDKNQREIPLNLVYNVIPNPDFDPEKAAFDPSKKKYRARYYIRDSADKKILEDRGYDEFPIWVWRYFRQDTDAYGVDGPGFKALGDTSQLYEEIKLKLTWLQKIVDPPTYGGPTLAGYPRATIPGFFTALADGSGKEAFKPVYELNPNMKELREDIIELKTSIDKICMADIFRMLSNDNRAEPRTAYETSQKIKEAYNLLATMYGALEYEVFRPMFEWLLNLFIRQGALPPVPLKLQESQAKKGKGIKIKFTSRIAQALRQEETSHYEKVQGFLQANKEIDPTWNDVVDGREFTKRYMKNNGMPHQVFKSEEQIKAKDRAAAAMQQKQMMAEQMPKVAGAVADLHQAGVTGNQQQQGNPGQAA